MKAPLAIVTMVYNESTFLPVWCRHYTAQVGDQACHVIDHGSDDGSTDALGRVSVTRLPRTPQDDTRRTRFLSEFCAALLEWYDAVIYVDVDELLVADPALFASLPDFTAAMPHGGVATAIGLDIVHRPFAEPDLDWARPVSLQRAGVRFSSAMCKPVAIRRPVQWAPGFHCIDAPPSFGRLFLFHLRYADLGDGLDRLARTRRQPWASDEAARHQRMSDVEWAGMLNGMAHLPLRQDGDWSETDMVLAQWVERVLRSAESREHDTYRIDLHLSGDELWRLPPRFLGAF
ncbi:hypothetical protein AA103196_2007 [Ameyamaea chiangmaiensis NBRC 103196]|uniref:Glycosyltransferase family 2 protein n=1 Tax=Ameyamaea chiangmaiensis TaxID=442969 RepID=A0A850PB66_9PROT|nr:glycosyltransferase family 2 protein [Ameyamaea chiangmaiensis]MBS4073728.1 glycosyltransferase family 2 protein [Ameyamaea chiangmaiensis]NVN39780.1 glycosyltransferase family 2 protein [Ameyamaea chiangmaiensis]GBQ68668.1 hypothetical protein AA103196_2007 [Ameyamaea chiangmaiensis NBRC 103196]